MKSHEIPQGRLLIDCKGGLGNQMFEYAAGMYFAQAFNQSLEIVKPPSRRQHWNGYRRPFQLTELSIEAKVRKAGILDQVFLSENCRVKNARSKLAHLLNIGFLEEPAPYKFHADLRPDPAKRNTYVTGYWQAASYVETVEADLRKQFRLRSQLTRKNSRYAEQIQNLRVPVSVHIRAGDYSVISHSVGEKGIAISNVLLSQYYERAFKALKELVGHYTMVVFSDEQEKAKTLLQGKDNCIFIEGNGADLAYEDLALMALCKHHIIANSSFSWWGAWLNPYPGKKVCAPKYWGNTGQSYFPDLYPSGWTIIDNL